MAINLRANERNRCESSAFWAGAIYCFSLAFPSFGPVVPLFGLMAFVSALETLVHCIMSPTRALAGDWLVGLSWLANPSAWAGIGLLMVGRKRHAALCGELALLLAACALRPNMLCQYVWLASMVYVVFAALRVSDDVSAADNAILAEPSHPRLRPFFYSAVALPILLGLMILLLDQGGHIRSTPLFPELDANETVYTGEGAKLRILETARRAARPGSEQPRIPASASNFWLYEDGNFSGSRTYWMFNCGSPEDCLKAVESLGGLRRKVLSPWQQSRYAVIMEGPEFYLASVGPSEKPGASAWGVRGIKNGLVYEAVAGNRQLDYDAIDLDRNCVYHVRESGGFPDVEYLPTSKQRQASPPAPGATIDCRSVR